MVEWLTKKYTKKHKKIVLYSNMGFGIPVHLTTFSNQISNCVYDKDTIYIFVIDELQSWFPKDTKNNSLLMFIDQLTGQFSQLGKRQIYVLATAQVYGRVNKNLREQCLFMVYCRPSAFKNKCVNDFIDGDDIMCDELGRWSGDPTYIWVHGLPKMEWDTHLMIRTD